MQAELDGILISMEKIYGGTRYAAVHGRVEDDFINHCRGLSGGHPKTAIQALVRDSEPFNGYTRTTAVCSTLAAHDGNACFDGGRWVCVLSALNGLQVRGEPATVRCYVDDELLLDFMQKVAMLPTQSLLLIASESPLHSFPRLCETYKCIHKDKIWSPAESRIKHANTTLVKAYVDYLLASNAQTFYGNRWSTFSIEMIAHFRHIGRRASFYNTILGPTD